MTERQRLYRRWLTSLDPDFPAGWGGETLEQALALREAIIQHAADNPGEWSEDWLTAVLIPERDQLSEMIKENHDARR